jgi:hypothetical protein
MPLANRIAAEHLEIATDDAEALAARIRNAGAIFIGRHTPEVIGDYVGGSNHVLPTARSARFSSGLSVLDYVKRTSILKLGPEQLQSLGPAAITLAQAEGLDAHARSVSIRMNQRARGWRGMMTADTQRLSDVVLDETIGRATPDVEHERAVAIFDLIEENSFEPVGHDKGPYKLKLSLIDSKLVFSITTQADEPDCHPYPVADAVPAHREGLFHDLRKLLRGDPFLDAEPDRGDRHGPARHPQRRFADLDGQARGQDQDGFRHCPAAVHAGLRAALARLEAAMADDI